jgi:hypothetical protein
MRITSVRVGWLLVSVALIFGVLTLSFWGIVREMIVVPIYYLIWVAALILKSIPQEDYLALLIVVCLIIAVSTLGRMREKSQRVCRIRYTPEATSRYQFWSRLCANLASSEVSRLEFATEARLLILSILAYQEGRNPSEIERQVATNDFDVPASVKELIQKRELPVTPGITSRLGAWRRAVRRFRRNNSLPKNRLIAEHLGEVIYFIECRLETRPDGS